LLYDQGLSLDKQGENTKAQAKYNEAIPIFVTTLLPHREAAGYRALGLSYLASDNYETATKSFNQSLSIEKKLLNNYNMAQLYIDMGDVNVRRENYSGAIKSYSSAAEAGAASGDEEMSAHTKNKLGTTAR